MTEEITECPNCSSKLKSGILSSITLLSDNKTAIINEYHDSKSAGYCNKCGDSLYNKYKKRLIEERTELIEEIQKNIGAVPVVTTHSPLNWNYEILQLVTGQSTAGVGALTESLAAFSNFWGTQSNRYNERLKEGENFCFAELRKQTLDAGGNAIIAVFVNYSVVDRTQSSGKIMVCATGTAIRLKNIDVLSQERCDQITEITTINDRLNELSYLDPEEI